MRPPGVQPFTLTLLPTYRCSAACRECCFESNPRIRHRVPQERLLQYIADAAALGSVRQICISGGEPFVLGSDLDQLVAKASALGLLTRVVTNGYWATSSDVARARLRRLLGAGLTEINFSTGDDHAEWVPVERVVHGLAVAFEAGLGVALMIEQRAARRVDLDAVRRAAAAVPAVLQALDAGRIHVVQSPWMPFRGEHVRQNDDAYANKANVNRRAPCRSIFTTLVVTPEERLGMCCGLTREGIPDLHAGSLRDSSMDALVARSANDFLKMWLFVEGPERILAWAAAKNPNIAWEGMYAHNCDACRRLYTDPVVVETIAAHYEERYNDVVVRFATYLTEVGDERAETFALATP